MNDTQYNGMRRIIKIAEKAGLDPSYGESTEPITKHNTSLSRLEDEQFVNIHIIRSKVQHKAFRDMLKIAENSQIQMENSKAETINGKKLNKEEIESSEYYNFWYKTYIHIEEI